ncbi:MAG: DUF6370 family protein [Gemmataceae bacterium]|nr:DUF6370 family protein [Gemmataceae bacterium]MCS7269647.1 DUF6370 family protein [Gemmataceae bacterium]MDW8242956.1 DUF6370 family protein [Thermogemmata sp.]
MLRLVVMGLLLTGLVGLNQAWADDKAETKTLKGTLTCTKCALKETKTCGHALIVKEDGKEIKYYLVDKGGREPYHGSVCTEDKPATVTGKVVEKDKKLYIEAPKVEVQK